MNKESRIIVRPKGDKVLMGNDFHLLEDESTREFVTDNVSDFIEFLDKFETDAYDIFYNEKTAKAFIDGKVRSNTPLATLNLEVTGILEKIIAVNFDAMNLSELELFLNSVKKYADENALLLLSTSRDFETKKVKSIKRKKERNGDYFYHVTMESAGNEDYKPLEKVGFTVPIFYGIEDKFKFSFEVVFECKDNGETVSVIHKLENYELLDEIKKAQRDIMKKQLSKIKAKKYWGNVRDHIRDDSWKYKTNGMNV